MKVFLTDTAKEQVTTIDRWWRENREKSPKLFTRELRAARERLSLLPHVGQIYSEVQDRVVCRLVFPRTRHLLYYEILGATVWVVSVWGAPKIGPPELSTPPSVD